MGGKWSSLGSTHTASFCLRSQSDLGASSEDIDLGSSPRSLLQPHCRARARAELFPETCWVTLGKWMVFSGPQFLLFKAERPSGV